MLASGLVWNTSQLYATGVVSTASAGLPGDYNNNGVDAADFVVWRANQGNWPEVAPAPVRLPPFPSQQLLCCWCSRRMAGVVAEAGPHRKYQQLIARETTD